MAHSLDMRNEGTWARSDTKKEEGFTRFVGWLPLPRPGESWTDIIGVNDIGRNEGFCTISTVLICYPLSTVLDVFAKFIRTPNGISSWTYVFYLKIFKSSLCRELNPVPMMSHFYMEYIWCFCWNVVLFIYFQDIISCFLKASLINFCLFTVRFAVTKRCLKI